MPHLAIAVEVARNYYFARRYDQAIDQARKAIELDPTFVQAHRLLGYAYEAIVEFKQAVNIYGALGEKDQAFALRSDPRFADLVRRVGLAVKQAEQPTKKASQ